MSRSYQHHALRNKFKEAYWAYVCYFSNKKSKREANQKFRTKNKHLMKKLLKNDIEDMDNVLFHDRVREVMDNWDFASDGLALHHYIDDEDKNWVKTKIVNK